MLKFYYTLLGCFLLSNGFAQFTISGQVKDARTDSSLPGATLQSGEKKYFAVTDEQGQFEIPRVPEGDYIFSVRFLGFKEHTISLTVHKDEWLDIRLQEESQWAQGITVYATRVSAQDPVAFTSLDKERIQKKDIGRDMPFLLDQTPSLVATSDAGTGIGYTGLRIRGSDATRINITINGIPFNDSESHGVFWVNMPDITSSAQSIQVQRGVGTSTNGAGAFGASININTSSDHEKPYLDLINSYGSFNTHRHTLSLGTGPVAKHFALDGRLSLIQSDGFIDRASADLRSFYVSGKYQQKKTTLEMIIFGGQEITYQSWSGVPESRLRNDVLGMRTTAAAEGWNEAQTTNLLTSNPRTFNVYTYKDQVDNYAQDHYQLHATHRFTPSLIANIALHYTYGRGYFEEFKFDQQFSNYALQLPTIEGHNIARTDLIRRRWLDNHFYGVTYSGSYKKKNYSTTVGGAWNRYEGAHFGTIIWAEVAATTPKDYRYYFSQGDKYDVNIFWKNKYSITKKIQVFLDLQYRRIDYKTAGNRLTQQGIRGLDIDAEYNFFNPKAGLTYTLSHNNRLYASYSLSNREPIRGDFVNAVENNAPRPETLYDLEVGWRVKRKKYALNINGYWMRYENQRVLTGEVNDVGAAIRTSADRSYRLGIEIEGTIQLIDKLMWHANATFSENKITEFTEVLYDYGVNFDEQNEIRSRFENVDISFSPSIIAGSNLAYTPIDGLELALFTKYVGAQFLDNTANQNRKIAPYVVNDLKLSYTVKPRFIKQATLSIFINNLLDEVYEANGYTYGYQGGGETVRQNYYFPQAGIHYTAMLSIRL